MRKRLRLFNESGFAARFVTRASVLALCAVMAPAAYGYNFAHFGGRLGRPGVTTGPAGTADFLYSWNKPDNGTITWWFERDQLPNASCDAACLATLKTLIQPELNKWALWLRINFAEAPSAAAADVLIHFTPTPAGTADAGPVSFTGTTLTKAEIRVDPMVFPDWSTQAARDGFCYYMLHEWGHILGLGDLYLVNHGNATFEGEDFCDHGLPSGPPPAGGPGLPDTRTKADNVMQAYGVKTLDNDEIHGAEWLWGCSGSNGIVTGELATRTGINNANEAAAHHGLTQTAKTWTYRGSVAASGGPSKVTLRFLGVQAARSIGPGSWTSTIYPDRIEFNNAGPYEGNFKFQIDCDEGPERWGVAVVAGSATTNFTAVPAGGGPQLFPFDQVYGADCGEFFYFFTCTNDTPDYVSSLNLELTGTEPVSVIPNTLFSPGCPAPTIGPGGTPNIVVVDYGVPCVAPGSTISFLASRPSSPIPLGMIAGTWSNGGSGGGPLLPDDIDLDCISDDVPNGYVWVLRAEVRYIPLNLTYGPWFHPPGKCWYRWCCYTGKDCYARRVLYVYKTKFGKLFRLRACIPLSGWVFVGTLPPGWDLIRQTWPPDGVVIIGPVGPPPNIVGVPADPLAGSAGLSSFEMHSDDQGVSYQPGTDFPTAFQAVRNALNISQLGSGSPPPITADFISSVQEMGPRYCVAADALQPLLDEINVVAEEEPDPLLDLMRRDIEAMQSTLIRMCNQLQTGVVVNPAPFAGMSQAMHAFGLHLQQLADQTPDFSERFINASENAQAISEAFAMAAGFVSLNMYDGVNDLSERDQFLWTQVARFPNELHQLAQAMGSHARINIPLDPPSFQSWQAEDQGEAVVTVVNRDQVNSGGVLDEYRARLSEFGKLIVSRPDREDGNVNLGVPLRVRVKYPRHLSRVVDIPVGDGLNVVMPPMIAGDVNGDDCIDEIDLAMVADDIGLGGEFAEVVPPTDVNADGLVTDEDLAIVEENLNQCGQALNDCNYNGVDDRQDIADGSETDCDGNGIPDSCDILYGFSENPCAVHCDKLGDVNRDGVVDGRDVQDFITCAMGGDEDPLRYACADMDGSGTVDASSDVIMFAIELLSE
ncbi:MAG: hypothetical protein H6818_22420 [Phycisphaerales bacterium]|nr:hypothetical protein [Phycisphaerales bacterium]